MTTYTLTDESKELILAHEDQVDIWVSALRSGEFEQDRCWLKTDIGFCCLGVFAVVVGNIEDEELFDLQTLNEVGDKQPLWPEQIRAIKEEDKSYVVDLIYLNDTQRLTFNQIADLLEHGEVTV